jgi:hypothetical protein
MRRIAWAYQRLMDCLAWFIFAAILGDIFEGWPSRGFALPKGGDA